MSPVIEQEHEAVNPGAASCPPAALILVVEDDDALLKLIERCLAADGHRTVGVSSGSGGPGLVGASYSRA